MKAKRLAVLGLSMIMTMSLCGEVSAADIQIQTEDFVEAGENDFAEEDIQVSPAEEDAESEDTENEPEIELNTEDDSEEESEITVEETESMTDDAESVFASEEDAVSTYSEGDSYWVGDYYINVVNGAAVITIYNGHDRVVNIPSSLDGYTVTEVSDSAFKNRDGSADIQEINVPDSVTEIGNYAFEDLPELKKVTIGKGVKSLCVNAFWGTSKLQAISVSGANPVFCTVDGILYNKQKTELIWVPRGITGRVTLQKGLTGIGESKLDGCTEITELTIPEGVKNIGYAAVASCTKLTKVTLPDSLQIIGYWAFSGCTSLTSINIGQNVTSIAYMAFGGCTSLKSLAIPKNVEYIANKACGYIRGEANDGSEDIKIADLKIYGEAGSDAETYARNNGFAFELKTFSWGSSSTNSGTAGAGTTATPAKNNTATTTKTFTASATKAQTYSIKVNANGRKVTYKSSNRKVKVSKTGKVTIPKNFTGTVKITATAPKTKKYAKLTKTFTFSVKKAANPLKVTTKNQKIKASAVKKKSKSFTIKTSNAQGKVTYKSSKSKYVTVSKKGKVVVKKGTPKGTYKITVTAAGKGIYGKKAKVLTVTVK